MRRLHFPLRTASLTLDPVSTAVLSHTSPNGAAAPEPGAPLAPAVPRRRVAPLDGLRGLALLAVLAYHLAPSAAPGGFLGVETFFVLSGYLLATLLLDEHVRTGAIDAMAYFRRRARRMAPALGVLVAVLLVAGPMVAPDDAHRLGGDLVSSVLGLTNWHLIADQASYFDRLGRPSLVRHLWSVAVELQFYVLCPFVVAWVARRRRAVAARALLAGVALSAGVMALLYRGADPSRAYYGTDARLGALLAGVLLALLLHQQRRRAPDVPAPRRARTAVVGAVGLAGLLALYLAAGDQGRFSYPLAFLATQAATAAVIAAALRPGPVAAVLGNRRLRWLGRRSYGIYLWHWPAVALLRPGVDVDWHPAVAGTVSVVVALVLGAVSYGLIERPMLAASRATGRSEPVRRRTGPVGWAAAAVVAGGVFGLFLHLPRTDPLAETLRAGQQLLAAQHPPVPAPTVPSTVPPTTAAPTTTLPPATAPPSTEAPPSSTVAPAPQPAPVPAPAPAPAAAPAPPVAAPRPAPASTVTAVGDSIMVSAAAALRDRLGPTGFIDAVMNRQFRDAAAIVRAMRDAGTLGSVVVVHLGTNGPVTPADIDAVVAEAPATVPVLLVNVRSHTAWAASVNQVLAEAPARHPRVKIVDWYAASEGHREWFQSDGTHFRTMSGPGANAYADLLVGSVPPPPAPAPAPPPAPVTDPATAVPTPVEPATTTVPPAAPPPPPA